MSKEGQGKSDNGVRLRLVAGVFVNPETEQAEIHVGDEGIDPIVVFADAVMQNMSMAIMLRRNDASKKQVLRASGPLPQHSLGKRP